LANVFDFPPLKIMWRRATPVFLLQSGEFSAKKQIVANWQKFIEENRK